MEVWADRLYGLWQALWQRLNWQMLLFFGAGVFLWRNILMPMVGDDYSYAFIWDGADAGNLIDALHHDVPALLELGDHFTDVYLTGPADEIR